MSRSKKVVVIHRGYQDQSLAELASSVYNPVGLCSPSPKCFAEPCPGCRKVTVTITIKEGPELKRKGKQ